VEILGQRNVAVLVDGVAVELHGAGGVYKVTRLLEELLVGEAAARDAECWVHHSHVGAALQLGLLAKLLAVRAQRVVVDLRQVLGGLVRVQGRHEAGNPRWNAQALETTVVILVVDARSGPSLECSA